jgi:hypothetical protein
MTPTATAISQLDSTAIDSFTYIESIQELTLSLPKGRYVYQGVPRQVVGEMLRAESVGAYFVAHIRNVYGFIHLN